MRELKKAYEHCCERYLREPAAAGMKVTDPARNVVGVGLGPKVKEGKAGPSSVRFYVDQKIRRISEIPPEHRLPGVLEGVPTDVLAIGRPRCGAESHSHSDQSHPRSAKPHVVRPGTSCGARFGRCGDGVTGTVGAIVRRGDSTYFLCSAHVLARANGFLLGAPILCPGPVDLPRLVEDRTHGGHEEAPGMPEFRETDFRRARLADFEPLTLDGYNSLDAALAEIPDSTRFEAEIQGVGRLMRSDPIVARKGMRVAKVGQGTGLTHGRIVDTHFRGRVGFALGALAFRDQILIEGDDDSAFAWEGDSGALVVTDRDDRRGVAMVVGFSMPEKDGEPKSYCVATRIGAILRRFKVEMVV
jgi:hypothetical protein